MTAPRVFRPGATITSMEEVASLLQARCWVYLFNRPKHPSVLGSMQFNTLAGFVILGALRVAIRNEQVDPAKEAA